MADTTLPGLLLSGLAAARPAASAVGSGALYVSTDTGVIEQSDGASWSTWATLGTAGAVTGPGSATDDDFVTWNGAGGDTLQDSGLSLDTDGTLAADSDAKIPSQKAVKTYADALIAANDAMVFKGVIDASANPNYPAANRGDTYRISVAGKIGGASGTNVEAGDLIICLDDSTSSGDQATVGSHWTIAQANIDGAVTGPASATTSDFATFSGTSGKVIQDSGLALDTDGTLTADSDSKLASQKAVKTYVDAAVMAAGGLPDPSGEPDGEVLQTSGGAAVWGADPGGGGGDTLNTIASSGSSLAIDYGNGNVQDITLDADCTFTLSGFVNGDPDFLTLILRQDGTGSRLVTWPTITWIGAGIPPILQTAAASVDTVVLFSFDGGTTVYGIAQTSQSGLRSGTSFPGSPSDGDLFYRTDSRILYEYVSSITKWLSLDRKYWTFNVADQLDNTTGTNPIARTPVFEDVYIESWNTNSRVNTTSDGSNFYTATLGKFNAAGSGTTISSFATSADTAGTWTNHIISIGAVVSASSHNHLAVTLAKTGTPGALAMPGTLVVRSVG